MLNMFCVTKLVNVFRLMSLSTTNGVGVLGEHCNNVTHVIEVVSHIIVFKIVSRDSILGENIPIMFPIVR